MTQSAHHSPSTCVSSSVTLSHPYFSAICRPRGSRGNNVQPGPSQSNLTGRISAPPVFDRTLHGIASCNRDEKCCVRTFDFAILEFVRKEVGREDEHNRPNISPGYSLHRLTLAANTINHNSIHRCRDTCTLYEVAGELRHWGVATQRVHSFENTHHARQRVRRPGGWTVGWTGNAATRPFTQNYVRLLAQSPNRPIAHSFTRLQHANERDSRECSGRPHGG